MVLSFLDSLINSFRNISVAHAHEYTTLVALYLVQGTDVLCSSHIGRPVQGWRQLLYADGEFAQNVEELEQLYGGSELTGIMIISYPWGWDGGKVGRGE